MAAGASVSAGAGWQDYAPSSDGWQDYQAPKSGAQQPAQPRGFAQNLWSDIKSIPSSLAGPDPIADPRVPDAEKSRLVSKMQSDAATTNAARTQQHGPAYSWASSAGEMLGVPVSGMEQSAEQGDVGGVLGHAAVVPTLMAAGELGARAPGMMRQAGPAATALAKTAATDAFSRVPVAGRLVRRPSLMDYVNAARTQAPAPINPALTTEARTLPGMNPPEVIRPPAQPIPPRSGLMLPAGPDVPGSQAGRLVDSIREQPSNMPTPESRAASDAAFASRYPNESMPDTMGADETRAWQQSAGFKVPEGAEDIGARLRQKNPEPTRADVALGRARKQAEALGQPRQRLIEQMGGKPPEAQFPPAEPAGPYDAPVKATRGLGEQLDDKVVKERLIDQIRKSDTKWMAKESAERAARNSPAQSKGFLTGQVDEHGVPINRAQAAQPTSLPEDLTEILRKSVEMAKKRRNPSAE